MTSSKSKISVIGAGGHTRSLVNLVRSSGYDPVAIVDKSYNEENNGETIHEIPVIGSLDKISPEHTLVLSVGAPGERKMLFDKYRDQVLKENLVHTSAIIEPFANFGIANQIFAAVYVNSYVKIGDDNILNTGAIIEHEAVIGNHCFISVRATLCGRVRIGNRCYIGAGAVIVDKVSICNYVTIGANSLVLHDITEPGVYVGSPVKRLK